MEYLESQVRIGERNLRADDPYLLKAKHELGKALLRRGREEEAEIILKELMFFFEMRYGKHGRETVDLKGELGEALSLSYEQEEALLKEALLGLNRQLGEDSAKSVHTQRILAGVLFQQGKFLDAALAYSGVMERMEREYGRESDKVLEAKQGYGKCMQEIEDYKEAERVLGQVREGYAKKYAQDHTKSAKKALEMSQI